MLSNVFLYRFFGLPRKLCFLLISIFCWVSGNAQLVANINNRLLGQTTTVEAFCTAEQIVVEQFFNEINIDMPGLENTKKAVGAKNWAEAVKSLITYYKLKKRNDWLTRTADVLDPNTSKVSNDALEDVFTFQDVEGKVKRLENGRIDWYYNGPKQDIEWAFFLNRHFFLNDLAHSYLEKNDAKYAKRCNELLFDWILSNPSYPKYTENQTWRPLEVGIRVGRSWVKTFYHLQPSPGFTDLTRLLMLTSIYDHAEYLTKFHGRHHNHAVSEFVGLNKIALNFPEFKKADNWYKVSVNGMQEEFVYSAYPDGAIKELTTHYHQVVTREFREFIELNRYFGKQLDPFFDKVVENLYNYTAYTAQPDGIGLNNNDSDLGDNFNTIKEANTEYKRADWDYIISNGKKGRAPKNKSIMFPWAGQFIMRNGYGEQPLKAQYGYFDMGPWGTTHQHNDKLHFSLYAGRDFLCDNGRMYYKGDSIKSYFDLSIGHNVIVLDDKGQNETAPETTKPIDSSAFSIQPQADFAISTYEDGFGDISRNAKSYSPNKSNENISGKHTRAVIFLKNRYWIVVDRIESDKPRRVTAFWHFNPLCTAKAVGEIVSTVDSGKTNLKILPIGQLPWKVSLVKGQDSPYVQGWFSDTYNNRLPAYCAEYHGMASKKTETFAWMMFPSQNIGFPEIQTQVLDAPEDAFHFKVMVKGEEPVEVAINMKEIKPVKLSDKSTFTGRCVILQESKAPIVIHGKLFKDGNTIAEIF